MIALVLFLLCTLFGRSKAFAFWENDLKYEGESVYNYLQVKEDEKSVVLATNVLFGVQSVRMKDGGLTGMYYDYALAACAMAEAESPRVLILGNGTGTYAAQCLRYFPGSSVEGVEIDGKITDLAREYFELPDAVQVTEYDGRAFLQAVDTRDFSLLSSSLEASVESHIMGFACEKSRKSGVSRGLSPAESSPSP